MSRQVSYGIAFVEEIKQKKAAGKAKAKEKMPEAESEASEEAMSEAEQVIPSGADEE